MIGPVTRLQAGRGEEVNKMAARHDDLRPRLLDAKPRLRSGGGVPVTEEAECAESWRTYRKGVF